MASEFIPENINFRGKYKKYDPNGRINNYFTGDVVEYNGKKYIAVTSFRDIIPGTDIKYWKIFEEESKFFRTDIEPQDSNEGDRWLDITTGIVYTRIRDNNGYHWVEF
jgi:hypothetical protein